MRRYGITLLILALAAALTQVRVFAARPYDDGQYKIEVRLEGGTGRAGITSPTSLTVANGEMTATVVWKSPYYEYMLVNGVYYHPIGTVEGGSAFEIPVVLDEDMDVSAQTIAMSRPHRIDYILFFDSSTVKPLNGVGTAAAVLAAAAVCVTAVPVVCIAAVKRRKRRIKTGKSGSL